MGAHPSFLGLIEVKAKVEHFNDGSVADSRQKPPATTYTPKLVDSAGATNG